MVVSILQWFALRDEYEEIKKEMEKLFLSVNTAYLSMNFIHSTFE